MGNAIKAAFGGALLGCAVLLGGPASGQESTAPTPQARYVALGSSFAAGPGIAGQDPASGRCTRSSGNYAHQLAERLGLRLVDVSCSGATTAHILGPWNELAPQIEAVTADTALVTITMGGNDVGYIGGLMAQSCAHNGGPPPGSPYPRCPVAQAPGEAQWQGLAASLDRVFAELRRRAPKARIILIDYLAVLPPEGSCAQVPLGEGELAQGRATAARLAEVMAAATRRAGVGLLRASDLSAAHHPCSSQPWANGYPPAGQPLTGAPYHPNRAGMTAIADALAGMLGAGAAR